MYFCELLFVESINAVEELIAYTYFAEYSSPHEFI